MKKKFGFTLAEVLITLGIIGIVAALTTPALVKNSGQAKIGPSLAKFVNTFETACRQLMTDESIPKIEKGKIPLLANYMIMTPIDKSYTFKNANFFPIELKPTENMRCVLIDINGQCEKYHDFGNNYIMQLKDGSIMAIVPIEPSNDYKSVGGYKGILAEVFVDIDGDKKDNIAGKDVFGFLLDKSGTLIPAGSNAHKYLADNSYGHGIYISEYATCAKSSGSSIVTDLACTGKIADNGWKADY